LEAKNGDVGAILVFNDIISESFQIITNSDGSGIFKRNATELKKDVPFEWCYKDEYDPIVGAGRWRNNLSKGSELNEEFKKSMNEAHKQYKIDIEKEKK